MTQLHNLREAEPFIRAGIPLVASVAWQPNKLDGGIKSTNGHLMVIGGFMGNGDVIAYDPASPDNPSVRHVYNREQFEKAWIPASGGIVYVDRPVGGRHALADGEQQLSSPAAEYRRRASNTAACRYAEIACDCSRSWSRRLCFAVADARASTRDEDALAQKYSPVVRLVEQPVECGPGEPYIPLDVDLLFGQPTVALRGPWNTTDLVKIGPSAQDLVNRFEYHLDFPGSALGPGCDYERWQTTSPAGGRRRSTRTSRPTPATRGSSRSSTGSSTSSTTSTTRTKATGR